MLDWIRKRDRNRRLQELYVPVESVQKEPYSNKILDDWLLLERLGEGAVALVYRAVPWETLDTRAAVAVKILKGKPDPSPEYEKRFQREAELCRDLKHPNIVNLLSWKHGPPMYMVMELVQGGTLRHRMQKGRLSIEQALPILEQMSAGLSAAHAIGIVHRDVKPENVLMTTDGVVKISDLSVARSSRLTTLTSSGNVVGSPAYMAPEQYGAGPVDARADQYSIGVIAFELLTGRRPFEHDDRSVLMFMQVGSPPPLLREYLPDAPITLEAVINRMLAKDSAERFDSVEHAALAMRDALK